MGDRLSPGRILMLRRGDASLTITWLVSTIIIGLILILFFVLVGLSSQWMASFVPQQKVAHSTLYFPDGVSLLRRSTVLTSTAGFSGQASLYDVLRDDSLSHEEYFSLLRPFGERSVFVYLGPPENTGHYLVPGSPRASDVTLYTPQSQRISPLVVYGYYSSSQQQVPSFVRAPRQVPFSIGGQNVSFYFLREGFDNA